MFSFLRSLLSSWTSSDKQNSPPIHSLDSFTYSPTSVNSGGVSQGQESPSDEVSHELTNNTNDKKEVKNDQNGNVKNVAKSSKEVTEKVKEDNSTNSRSIQNIDKIGNRIDSNKNNDKRKSSNVQTSPPKPVRKIDSINVKLNNNSPKVQIKSSSNKQQDVQQHQFVQRNNHANVQKSVHPNLSPTLQQKQMNRVQITSGSAHSSPRQTRGAIAAAKHPQALEVRF